jgi:hypothetical protein
MASFDCPRCGHFQLVDDKHIGRNATCPKCKARGVVQASMPASPPPPPAETVFYESPIALITNTRAIINGVTYSLANITTASCSRTPLPSWRGCGWYLLLLFGMPGVVLGLLMGLDNMGVHAVASIAGGLLFTALGIAILVYVSKEPQCLYRLQIGSAGGEKHALESKRRGDIEPIVDALSKAIVARG